MSEIILGINRIAFYIGNIPIAWYGITMTLAIVSAFLLFIFLAKKRGIDMDFCLELFIWVVPIAVLFARLGYTLPKAEYYPIESFGDFLNLFNITEGGITIIGAIIGGVVGVFLCCLRTKKYHMAKVADCVVIALLLGQVIGRWGNFFNQELYGAVITNPAWQWFPFAVFIDHTGQYHNALFFYEGLINLAGLAMFLVLFFKCKDKIKPMGITLLYIFWYGLVRSSLEYIKYDPQLFSGTNIGIAQTVCYVEMAVALALFIPTQMGKLRFETKWFEEKIALKAKKVAEKLLAVEEALRLQNASNSGAETSETINSESVNASVNMSINERENGVENINSIGTSKKENIAIKNEVGGISSQDVFANAGTEVESESQTPSKNSDTAYENVDNIDPYSSQIGVARPTVSVASQDSAANNEGVLKQSPLEKVEKRKFATNEEKVRVFTIERVRELESVTDEIRKKYVAYESVDIQVATVGEVVVKSGITKALTGADEKNKSGLENANLANNKKVVKKSKTSMTKDDKTTKAVADKTTKASADKTTKAVADKTTKASTDKTTKAGADKTTKADADKTTKASTDKTTKAVADKTTKAGADKTTKSVADKTAKSVADKTAKADADKTKK